MTQKLTGRLKEVILLNEDELSILSTETLMYLRTVSSQWRMFTSINAEFRPTTEDVRFYYGLNHTILKTSTQIILRRGCEENS